MEDDNDSDVILENYSPEYIHHDIADSNACGVGDYGKSSCNDLKSSYS